MMLLIAAGVLANSMASTTAAKDHQTAIMPIPTLRGLKTSLESVTAHRPTPFLPTSEKLSTLHSAVKLRPGVASGVQELRHTQWGQRASRALNDAGGDAPSACSDPASDFMAPLVTNVDPEIFDLVYEWAIAEIPLYYKLFVDHQEDDEYFGPLGKETGDITLANSALNSFWGSSDDDGGSNLVTDNILLLGMHGADMEDRDKLIPTLEIMFDLIDPEFTYSDLADTIQYIVELFPKGYQNPIFTFNAIASSDSDEFGGDRIVMGDGVIEYLRSQNLGEYGPEVALSHEYGHQMQFEIIENVTENGALLESPSASETRRFELFADALSGYFLAHRNGGNIQDNGVLELSKAAFAVGDCSIDSDEHHGTPSQRDCALTWGINQAAASTAGDILHPDELQALFDEDLQDIISLDDSVCRNSFAANATDFLPGGAGRVAPGAVEKNVFVLNGTVTITCQGTCELPSDVAGVSIGGGGSLSGGNMWTGNNPGSSITVTGSANAPVGALIECDNGCLCSKQDGSKCDSPTSTPTSAPTTPDDSNAPIDAPSVEPTASTGSPTAATVSPSSAPTELMASLPPSASTAPSSSEAPSLALSDAPSSAGSMLSSTLVILLSVAVSVLV